LKILVADDDHVSLTMMKRMLLQSGYDVTTVSNGAEAVDKVLEDNGPRLMILDWMMPVLDGPEVCRSIRTSAQRPYVFIVLLTARYLKDDLVAGLNAGADDYLTKPCHAEELRARLQTGERILQLEDSLVMAREEMRFRATHDSLTLIQNRGTIVRTLSAALNEKCGGDPNLAVVLCDIDHFKSINDTYGHPVGDEVLREVARRLQCVTGPGDAVGRFGGEEFLCVLRNCPSGVLALRVAEICQVIRSRPMETSVGPLFVSMSAGAISASSVGLNLDVDQILRRTDVALYRAKRDGRDRAVVDGDPETEGGNTADEPHADRTRVGDGHLLYAAPRISMPV
jgi:two-component system cell cycle response regulator